MKLERLDKIIASQTSYSRKDIKKLISEGKILLNKNIIKDSGLKVDLEKDEIIVNNQKINFQKNVYLILNKPKGYVSATEDKKDKVVLELVPEKYKNRELFPAGRLDKDTTGLMIITDDGMFAHEILAPKKHVCKTYEVEIDIPVTEEMKQGFKQGVRLNDGECKTADLKILDKYNAQVTLTEGRYHQIKRMFGCYGAKVVNLKRISIGTLKLPDNLKEGECRELSENELNLIKMK